MGRVAAVATPAGGGGGPPKKKGKVAAAAVGYPLDDAEELPLSNNKNANTAKPKETKKKDASKTDKALPGTACESCRKTHLKCVPRGDGQACGRCADRDDICSYTRTRPAPIGAGRVLGMSVAGDSGSLSGSVNPLPARLLDPLPLDPLLQPRDPLLPRTTNSARNPPTSSSNTKSPTSNSSTLPESAPTNTTDNMNNSNLGANVNNDARSERALRRASSSRKKLPAATNNGEGAFQPGGSSGNGGDAMISGQGEEHAVAPPVRPPAQAWKTVAADSQDASILVESSDSEQEDINDVDFTAEAQLEAIQRKSQAEKNDMNRPAKKVAFAGPNDIQPVPKPVVNKGKGIAVQIEDEPEGRGFVLPRVHPNIANQIRPDEEDPRPRVFRYPDEPRVLARLNNADLDEELQYVDYIEEDDNGQQVPLGQQAELPAGIRAWDLMDNGAPYYANTHTGIEKGLPRLSGTVGRNMEIGPQGQIQVTYGQGPFNTNFSRAIDARRAAAGLGSGGPSGSGASAAGRLAAGTTNPAFEHVAAALANSLRESSYPSVANPASPTPGNDNVNPADVFGSPASFQGAGNSGMDAARTLGGFGMQNVGPYGQYPAGLLGRGSGPQPGGRYGQYPAASNPALGRSSASQAGSSSASSFAYGNDIASIVEQMGRTGESAFDAGAALGVNVDPSSFGRPSASNAGPAGFGPGAPYGGQSAFSAGMANVGPSRQGKFSQANVGPAGYGSQPCYGGPSGFSPIRQSNMGSNMGFANASYQVPSNGPARNGQFSAANAGATATSCGPNSGFSSAPPLNMGFANAGYPPNDGPVRIGQYAPPNAGLSAPSHGANTGFSSARPQDMRSAVDTDSRGIARYADGRPVNPADDYNGGLYGSYGPNGFTPPGPAGEAEYIKMKAAQAAAAAPPPVPVDPYNPVWPADTSNLPLPRVLADVSEEAFEGFLDKDKSFKEFYDNADFSDMY